MLASSAHTGHSSGGSPLGSKASIGAPYGALEEKQRFSQTLLRSLELNRLILEQTLVRVVQRGLNYILLTN